MTTKVDTDDEDYSDWEFTAVVPDENTPIPDVIARAEQELFACGEWGEDFRPETVAALLRVVKTLQGVIADVGIDQYMRENGYTHIGQPPAESAS